MHARACTCEDEPCTAFGQGGVAPSWLPPAPKDLPACGFRNQIIGSEAAQQLSLDPPGLPRVFRKRGLAEKPARPLRRYGGCVGEGRERIWREKTEMVPPPAGPLLSLRSSNSYLFSMYTLPGTGATRAGTRAVPKPTSLPSQPSAVPSVSSLSSAFLPSVSGDGKGRRTRPGGLAHGPAHRLMETTWRVRTTPPPEPPPFP